MQSIAIAATVLACMFGGALLGLLLRARLPAAHFNDDAKDMLKLMMGLVATMVAWSSAS